MRDRIWVVVPMGRAGQARHIERQIRRQSVRDRVRLIVVENGAGLGACRAAGLEPDVLATSEPDGATAKNVGLEIARSGGGLVAFMDDDDHYMDRYLERSELEVREEQAVGTCRSLILFDDGLWRFEREHSRHVDLLPEGTVVVRAEECAEWTPGAPNLAGRRWARVMLAAGGKLWLQRPGQYIWDRRGSAGDHSFKMNRAEIIKLLGNGKLTRPRSTLPWV